MKQPARLQRLLIVLAVVAGASFVLHSLPAPESESQFRARTTLEGAQTDNSLFASAVPRAPEAALAPYDGQGTCRVSGVITDQLGRTVEDCPISIVPGRGMGPAPFFSPGPEGQPVVTRTDAAGRYAIEGVAVGDWFVGPSAPPWPGMSGPASDARPAGMVQDAIAAFGTSVSVAAGQTEVDLDLRVHRGLYIRGTIVADGSPHSTGHVRAHLVGTQLDLYGRSDDSGSFVVGPLLPGRYSLVASAAKQYRESEAVDASPGDAGVVLALRPGGRITGWIEDLRTGRACKAKLTLNATAPAEPMTLSTWSSDNGEFDLDRLAPGTYDICARTGARTVGFARSVNVREGATVEGLKIRLELGCVLRVKCARAGVLTLLDKDLVVATSSVSPGEAIVEVVPSGSVRLRLADGRSESPEVMDLELAIGMERDVLMGGN